MTNPIPYIRNKFCFWLTGLTHDEIANLIDKVNEKEENNDYISKSDFDPDDYDFSPLSDYDFSEFVLSGDLDDQIQCYIDNACDFVSRDDIDDYTKLEPFDKAITEIKNRLDALEKKSKKKKKKESKPE